MAEVFSPQFETHQLDLDIKKGATAKLVVTVSGSYDFNIQNSLIFTEVRQDAPGYFVIPKIVVSTTSGSPIIKIAAYPLGLDANRILLLLPIQSGDLVTVEGSGIQDSKVLSVSSTEILVSNSATATIVNSRISHRSLPVTSFNVEPIGTTMSISTTNIATSGAITVSGVTSLIPAGTQLVFSNGTDSAVRTVTQDALAGSTTLQVTGSGGNTGTYTAAIGSQLIFLQNSVNTSSVNAVFKPFSYHIPVNTTLHFATKGVGNSKDGWKYQGSFRTTATTVANSNTVAIDSINPQFSSIPADSVAIFSTIKSNQFRLILETVDSKYVPTGTYKYDVICRFPSGEVIRIIQGNCTFTDNWSDLL